ncbi:MAG: helix-turn-helix domain-containing protein [Bacteroidales bacterium]|nr:helix-turn-helix domain-containing protein [Bacteroidales bacterium]
MTLEDVFSSIDRIEEKVNETLEVVQDLNVSVALLEKAQMPVGKLLEVKEAANHIGVNVRTLYEEIKAKRLPAAQINQHGKYFIKAEDLKKYMLNMKEESDDERLNRIRKMQALRRKK